ncbi:hypothetical protein [Methylobacterium sp. WL30]|uniref:hypothetical protein n=1 Tax=unclassified Methylobacterium TaxID=2615210 RepID=UPI0032B16E2D
MHPVTIAAAALGPIRAAPVVAAGGLTIGSSTIGSCTIGALAIGPPGLQAALAAAGSVPRGRVPGLAPRVRHPAAGRRARCAVAARPSAGRVRRTCIRAARPGAGRVSGRALGVDRRAEQQGCEPDGDPFQDASSDVLGSIETPKVRKPFHASKLIFMN